MFRCLANSIRNTWLFGLVFFWLGFTMDLDGESSQFSSGAEWIVAITFAFLVALWVSRDTRCRDRDLGFDFPALVFFCWPFFGPLYLFQTRGWRAFLNLIAFVAMAFIGMFAGAIVGFAARLQI